MTRRGFVIAAVLGFAGCGPPHALRYLENPSSEEEETAEPSTPDAEKLHAWPIYERLPVEDCGPGLIGTSCERGLLQREAPIEEEDASDPEP